MEISSHDLCQEVTTAAGIGTVLPVITLPTHWLPAA